MKAFVVIFFLFFAFMKCFESQDVDDDDRKFVGEDNKELRY